MISDPYTFGIVVAVHALSDVHAMGIRAHPIRTGIGCRPICCG
jgi:selenophosphate synthase